MDNIWLHILILIPIEFGILHATPLGPALTGIFSDIFAGLGFEFAQAAADGAHTLGSCGVEGCSVDHSFSQAANTSTTSTLESFTPAPENTGSLETLDLDAE